MTRGVCFCGCGDRQTHLHHVVYQQEIRRAVKSSNTWSLDRIHREAALVADMRNRVPAGLLCHAAHHNRSRPYELRKLPDSAYEYALEVLGAGPAYEFLRRRYNGADPRLQTLLEAA